jgi:hypothetical protein
VFRADRLGDVLGVRDQLADGAHTEATGSVGPESDYAAGRCDRPELVVGEVAGELLQGPGAGV